MTNQKSSADAFSISWRFLFRVVSASNLFFFSRFGMVWPGGIVTVHRAVMNCWCSYWRSDGLFGNALRPSMHLAASRSPNHSWKDFDSPSGRHKSMPTRARNPFPFGSGISDVNFTNCAAPRFVHPNYWFFDLIWNRRQAASQTEEKGDSIFKFLCKRTLMQKGRASSFS